MAVRYITAAQADDIRLARVLVLLATPLGAVDRLRTRAGVVGVATTDYYIVPDDDPRLKDQPAPDPPTTA